MKSGYILLLAFVCILSTSSCIKKYTCHCDFTYTGAPDLPQGQSSEYSITDTKSTAISSCSANSTTYDRDGIHTVENCYLY
jgi:hypothetical protein